MQHSLTGLTLMHPSLAAYVYVRWLVRGVQFFPVTLLFGFVLSKLLGAASLRGAGGGAVVEFSSRKRGHSTHFSDHPKIILQNSQKLASGIGIGRKC